MRIGVIARSDNTGLGNQTRELVNMLGPEKVLLIDSSHFNSNKQNPEWYAGYNVTTTRGGFATDEEVIKFLNGIDVVISCEIFYNKKLVPLARKRGIKTILQYNYEFLDNLQTPNTPLPDVLLAPSKWNIEDVQKRFENQCKVVHLPPPTDHNVFNNNRIANSQTSKKLLHIAGKAAVMDRNGTETVIEMMKYSTADFTLEIRSQTNLPYKINDDRIKIITENTPEHSSMYSGYDAMVLPRRYAGLCLPMNEALLSGLPVFMTDISPNNFILPERWLVKATKTDTLMTRTLLDVYSADPVELARIVDDYMNNIEKASHKLEAFNIGYKNFSQKSLKSRYIELINSL